MSIDEQLEVFKTAPVLVPKVWGGRKLADVFGKELPDDQPYGESWEVSDLPEGQSTVCGGAFDGEALGVLVDRFAEALVGTAAPAGRFPLLVKLLDAAKDLSVQVHPGPEQLADRPEADSKDESWIILDTDPDASIIHGLVRESTVAEIEAALEDGTLIRLLHRLPVVPGDVFRVPPGTIHAICAGVTLLEIQQPSDTTYRVYDYDRPGLDGKPRALHLEDALDVAYLGPTLPEERGLDQSVGLLVPGVRVLANVDAYRIERFEAYAPMNWSVSPHSAQVVHVLRGSCCVDDVLLGPADTAVIPAAIGRVFVTYAQDCELVVAGLGGPALVAR